MKVLVDLSDKVLKEIEKEAIHNQRSRKKHIEWILHGYVRELLDE